MLAELDELFLVVVDECVEPIVFEQLLLVSGADFVQLESLFAHIVAALVAFHYRCRHFHVQFVQFPRENKPGSQAPDQ